MVSGTTTTVVKKTTSIVRRSHMGIPVGGGIDRSNRRLSGPT